MSLSVLPSVCSQRRADSFQALAGLHVTRHINVSSFGRNSGLKDGTKLLTAVGLGYISIRGLNADVLLGV